jgi:GTP cyclohydrolase I
MFYAHEPSARSGLQLTPERVAMLPQAAAVTAGGWEREEPLLLEAPGRQPAFDELRKTPRHARALWQQICAYEHDFFPRRLIYPRIQIETRAHAFPWSEKTFASNQGERYLNYR